MKPLTTEERIAALKRVLPTWEFHPYGETGAIVCYPLVGWNTNWKVQFDLNMVAPIAGVVSGNGLVICRLHSEPAGSGVHPLAVF